MDKSIWKSIVDKVQPLVPTIDANSSWSEDEANTEIFQRPSGLSLRLPDDQNMATYNTDMEGLQEVTEPEKRFNKQKLDTASYSNEKSTSCNQTNAVVLSFSRLEHLDFDFLQYTVQNKQNKQQHKLTELRNCKYGDRDKEDYDKSILEKITSVCERQSTISPRSPCYDNKTYVGSLGDMPEETMCKEEQRPTVYIDLRCQNQTSPSPLSSSALYSVHKEANQVNRPNEASTGSQANCWNETGKSMLLRKIRENNRRNKYMRKRVVVVDTNPSCIKSESIKPQTECYKSRLEISKKQRDHHRKQHRHIVNQLEKCRPTKSDGQRQPAAAKTDLLYDLEASYLEPVRTLPAEIDNEAHMMLTVNLSNPGMVAEKGQRKRPTIDSALTKSHIYNTLVAWFLSLVDPNPNSINKANAAVPFWVTGLQQLWTDNGLALHVFIVAKHNYTQRKRDSDIYTPFYNHICRFLSQTSLSTVAYWLPQLNVLVSENTDSRPICLPSCCLSSLVTATSNKIVISRIFSLSPGFYWKTLETPGHECKGRETTQELHTEVSIALGSKSFFQIPLAMHYTIQTILESGLDICGLRLLYPSSNHLDYSFGYRSIVERGCDSQCVLAVAVRGPFAHPLLQGINGSLEIMLRQKAFAAENGEDVLPLCTPQQHKYVHKELCLWFSGKLNKDRGKYQDPSFKSDVQVPLDNASFLCASTKADILLVVSPLIPPSCYGKVLSTCERRGFILRGLQRMEIHNDRASVLGFTSQQVLTFCTSASQNCHCLMMILGKENALHHSITLPGALVKEFKRHNLLNFLLPTRDAVQTVEPSLCFHTAPFSNNLHHNFARSTWAVPDPSSVVLSHLKCPLDLETDELVVLTLCGQDMSQGLDLLHRALTQHGFELLGVKWLPMLTRLQAQEVSPFEVGEKSSLSALVFLTSVPALVCSLRHKNAVSTLRKLVPDYSTENGGVLMSPTPQVATRQMALFFFELELIPYAVEKRQMAGQS